MSDEFPESRCAVKHKESELEARVFALFEQMTRTFDCPEELSAEWELCYAAILANPTSVAPWATAMITQLGVKFTARRQDHSATITLVDQVMCETGALYIAPDRKDFDEIDILWLRCLRADAFLRSNEQKLAAKAFAQILSTAHAGGKRMAHNHVFGFLLYTKGELATDAIDPDLAEVVRQLSCALSQRKTAPPVQTMTDVYALLESARRNRRE